MAISQINLHIRKGFLILLLLLPLTSQSASISDYSPQAHWTFDDIVTDSVGGLSWTLFNSPTYVSSVRNKGLDFERGSSQYATIADSAPVRIDDGWTLTYWMKIESLNNWMAPFRSRSGENGWGLLTYADGTMDIQSGSGSFSSENEATGLTTATDYFVMAYWNGASSKLLINCTEYSSNIPAITNPNVTVNMAKDHGSSNYFDGIIDEVTIFNTNMVANCATLYNGGVPLPYTGSSGSSSSTATSTSLEDDNIVFSLAVIVFLLGFITVGFIISVFRR